MVSDVWSYRWWWGSDHMDGFATIILTILITLAVISLFTWVLNSSKREKVPLPPGPRGLPVIGSLLSLDPNLHRCFSELANSYGPIMKLQLGRKLCIVVSSPLLAKEILKDHDTIFANRDVPVIAFIGSYGGVDMIWSPYGAHWRMLRKVCVTEMLNSKTLDALYDLRRREVRRAVSQIYSKINTPADIGELMLLTMFNIMTSMLWGVTLKGEEKNRVITEFREVIEKIVGLLGEINLSDLFPAIACFDIQGIGSQMKKLMLWFDRIFDYVIDQRIQMERLEKGEEESKDLLQVLLQLVENGDPKTPFTMTHIKALFVDMMIAGTKTTSTTVEWALAELLKHPEIMKKCQEELEDVVGFANMVEEFHLPKLHYLQGVVKEVLRLHPTVPLLAPHCPSVSSTVGGFMVPKGTKVLVNAWAIHRDPMAWDHPLEFQPERFWRASSEFDYSGKDFRYIPFGSGRRICVGIPMAERMVPYLLASLLHAFQWQLPNGTELDMSDKFGLELKKATPLTVIPTPRLSDLSLYN